jgi:hypothetical protein
MAERMRRIWSIQRRWWPMVSTVPDARQSAIMASASASEQAIGFSQ